jgi:ABC-type lipoprotein release transport system permease subunit
VFEYAWKGFCRRRTRSLLVVLGIALSIGLLVAVVTITGSVGHAIASSLDAAGADMVIQKRVKACPFNYVKLPKDLAPIDASVVDKLRAFGGVQEASGVLELWAFHVDDSAPAAAAGADKAAAPDLGFPKPKGAQATEAPAEGQGMATGPNGKPLQPTVVVGIDPTKKTIGPVRVSTREETDKDDSCCAVTRGRYLVSSDDYQTMLTEGYAQAKGLDIGDMIPLGLQHKYEVVALLDVSGAARIASGEAFVSLKAAQDLLGQGPVVDTIFISLEHGRDSEAVATYARQLIGDDISITTEGNVDAGTAALASVTRNSMLAVSGFVLLFTLLLLVRNALDNVAHRVSEVGLMKAIGWRNADVARLFVAEALFAGLFGGVLGSGLGSLAGWMYGHWADLRLPASLNYYPPCSATEAPLALRLTTDPSVAIFALGMASALVIGTIAGLAASRRAARLDPVDALRRL